MARGAKYAIKCVFMDYLHGLGHEIFHVNSPGQLRCALGRVKTCCCALFEEFFNPKNVREAAPGPPHRCSGTPGHWSKSPLRALGDPRLDFC